jgi:hypothetical protein
MIPRGCGRPLWRDRAPGRLMLGAPQDQPWLRSIICPQEEKTGITRPQISQSHFYRAVPFLEGRRTLGTSRSTGRRGSAKMTPPPSSARGARTTRSDFPIATTSSARMTTSWSHVLVRTRILPSPIGSSVTAVALSVDSNVSRVSAVKTRSGRGLAHPRQTGAMMARRFPPPWTVEERRLASSSATTTGKHSLSCMRGRALGLKSTPDQPRRIR